MEGKLNVYILMRRETERLNLLPSVRRSIQNWLEPSETMASGSVAENPAVESFMLDCDTDERKGNAASNEPVWRKPEQRFVSLIRSK